MSVLNTLLCGGRAAQPPEGKYGECFSYSLRYSLIISLRFFFSFAHFIVCFMSEIAQALPSSYAPGTSGYIFFFFFFFVLSLFRPVDRLKSFQKASGNILWHTLCTPALQQSVRLSHAV